MLRESSTTMKDINDRIRNGEFHPAKYDGETVQEKCLAATAAFRFAVEQEFADTTWSDPTLDALWDVASHGANGVSMDEFTSFYEKCANLVALGFDEGERRQADLTR